MSFFISISFLNCTTETTISGPPNTESVPPEASPTVIPPNTESVSPEISPEATPPAVPPIVSTLDLPSIDSHCADPTLALSDISKHTFYIDPINGNMANDGSETHPWKTLAEVITANKIKTKNWQSFPPTALTPLIDKNSNAPVHAGDTLILKNGNHGDVFIKGYYNDAFIIIKAAPGETPILNSLGIRSASKFYIEGLTVTKSASTLILIENNSTSGNTDNIFISKNQLYSQSDASAFTATDWVSNTSYGITANGLCTTVYKNELRNVRTGIQMLGKYSLAQENTIKNFSADGMRVLNSDIGLKYNLILDAYVSAADGDGNHDDGIQSFNLDVNNVFDNITLEGNRIIESTDPNRPFQSDLQGIGIFDGYYNNLKIINNIIFVSAYHGISIYGPKNSLIANNTIFGGPNVWLGVFNRKSTYDGGSPENTLVINNLVNKMTIALCTNGQVAPTQCVGGVQIQNNIVTAQGANHFQLFDWALRLFDPHLKPTSSAIGAGVSLSDVLRDADLKYRPTGARAVGALEP